MAPKSFLFLAFIYFTLQPCIYGQILRASCVREADFYLKAVNHKVKITPLLSLTTTDLEACFDECLEHPNCSAINGHRRNSEQFMCELIELKKSRPIRWAWSWQYYDSGDDFILKLGPFCRSLTYNPCYPCRCRDSCNTSNFECNCDRLPATQPTIYIPFEKGENVKKSYYVRGARTDGNTSFDNLDAVLVQSNDTDRVGMVIQTQGAAFVTIEQCTECLLRTPDKITIAFWVLHHYKAFTNAITYLLHSAPIDADGIILQHSGSEVSFTAQIYSSLIYYECKGVVLKEILLKWTHVALTFSKVDKIAILYVNGKEIARGNKELSRGITANLVTDSPVIMAVLPATVFHPSDFIQIDDFVEWERALKPEEILYLYGIG